MKYRHSIPRLAAESAFALAVAALITGTQAATRIKQDNPDALNLASSWNTLPGAADIAQWDAPVTAVNSSATLGGDLSWAGIKIISPGGLVTITAGNTLTVGTSGIDLSAATQNLTISSGLTVLGKQNWSAAAGRTLNVAGTFTRNGATVDFTSFNTTATLGTLVNETSGILGPWATTGSTISLQYVTSSSGTISAYTGATPATAADLSNVTSATTNYNYAAAATLVGNQSANTLRYTGGATSTTLGANGLTLNGLMNAGSGALTITSTAGNPGLVIGASGELDIISNDKTLTLGTRITGTGTVVYNAVGNITFGAAAGSPGSTNDYGGGTVINGTSQFTTVGVGTFFGSGSVTVNGGTMFFSNNTLANNFTFNGGLAKMNNSFGSTLNGTITLAVPTEFRLDTNGQMVIGGNVTGAGGLTKTQGTNNGPLQLTNANNDYAGPTTVSAGILQVKSSLYGNDTSKWTPANISVASDATFALNIGGASDFSTANAGTMLTNLLTSVNNNGLKLGSLFGLSTQNATGTVSFATTITDSVGTGGGAVGLRKLGANTLELTGDNTYSGRTRIDAGTLSVNNIANIVATSSALGAPSGANEAISIGYYISSGTLLYTGAGHSTDRTIQIGTNSPAAPVAGDTGGATIQNDGAGPLTFSGTNFNTQTNAATGVGGSRTLTLQGSNGGTISGIIRNNLVTGTATGTAAIALTKAGTGTWVLGGANTYTGTTTINDGALQAISGTGLPTNTILQLRGGVFQSSGTFSRVVSTAAGAVNWGTGSGGFAAKGAPLILNLNGGTGSLTWNGSSMVPNGQTLIFGSTTADDLVDFQNDLNLGSSGPNTRTITVNDNPLSATDRARISGAITNTLAGQSLLKDGAGTLELTKTNTYSGTTTVSAGTLVLGATGSIATSSSINLAMAAVLDTTSQPFTMAAAQPVTINLDPADTGSSGRIKAAALNITNAEVTLTADAPLDDVVYILADYTSLAGTSFATVNLLTGTLAGYTIDYAYNGGTQIALVPATGYVLWAGFQAGGEGADLDFDQDGVSNGIEYFMGEFGDSFTATPGLDGTNTVTWSMDPDYSGTYEVQTSPDLSTWTNVYPRPLPAGGYLSYQLPTGLGKRFVRLLVTPAP